jgi:hypothetical protein
MFCDKPHVFLRQIAFAALQQGGNAAPQQGVACVSVKLRATGRCGRRARLRMTCIPIRGKFNVAQFGGKRSAAD